MIFEHMGWVAYSALAMTLLRWAVDAMPGRAGASSWVFCSSFSLFGALLFLGLYAWCDGVSPRLSDRQIKVLAVGSVMLAFMSLIVLAAYRG